MFILNKGFWRKLKDSSKNLYWSVADYCENAWDWCKWDFKYGGASVHITAIVLVFFGLILPLIWFLNSEYMTEFHQKQEAAAQERIQAEVAKLSPSGRIYGTLRDAHIGDVGLCRQLTLYFIGGRVEVLTISHKHKSFYLPLNKPLSVVFNANREFIATDIGMSAEEIVRDITQDTPAYNLTSSVVIASVNDTLANVWWKLSISPKPDIPRLLNDIQTERMNQKNSSMHDYFGNPPKSKCQKIDEKTGLDPNVRV